MRKRKLNKCVFTEIFIYFIVEDESVKNSSTTSNPMIGKYSIKRF